MHFVISDAQARIAAAHLSRHDTCLAPVIRQTGPCTIRPHTDYYHELVRSIIGQQLSVKAAATITDRFTAIFAGAFPAPQAIINCPDDTLRAAGLSRSKVAYVKDLARHVLDGRIDFADIEHRSNEQIIIELTAVKGIGEWTAHMFLMWAMGRLDVLPTGDLGVRMGMQKLYGLPTIPAPAEMIVIAEQHHWHPFESVASWYVWQYLDNAPGTPRT
ncbi:DNA-3-methyladenine glycosylase 2 family protein [Candidatus Saccharibacteria bacterium]|nr:DNA-3-methyladenine glycosylase 2 family protein [Candidatus Saccharibacteria bacterium]